MCFFIWIVIAVSIYECCDLVTPYKVIYLFHELMFIYWNLSEINSKYDSFH